MCLCIKMQDLADLFPPTANPLDRVKSPSCGSRTSPAPGPLTLDQMIAAALASTPGATAVRPVAQPGGGILIGYAPAVPGFPPAPIILVTNPTNGRPAGTP